MSEALRKPVATVVAADRCAPAGMEAEGAEAVVAVEAAAVVGAEAVIAASAA